MTMNTVFAPVAVSGRWLLWSARLSLALMIVVVVTSAWLRLAAPRVACADWPGCRSASVAAAAPDSSGGPGDVVAGAGAMSAASLLARLRGAHRLAASLMLPTVLALAVLAWRARLRGLLERALGMGIIALALAALGIVTPGSRSAAVMLGNFLGGVALLALAWSALCLLRSGAALPRPTARWALAGAAAWALQASLGVLSGAPAELRPRLPMPLLHLSLALPALMWAGAIGLSALRTSRRREGAALVVVAVLQTLLGLSAAGRAAAPAVVLVHGLVGVTGVALLVGLGSAEKR